MRKYIMNKYELMLYLQRKIKKLQEESWYPELKKKYDHNKEYMSDDEYNSYFMLEGKIDAYMELLEFIKGGEIK